MKQRARTHSPSPIPAARATRREHWTRTAGLADPEAARPQAYDHARLLALPVGSGAIPIQQSRGVRPSAALARARRDQVEPLPTLPAGREPLARVAAAPPAGRQAERTRAPAPDDTDTAGKQAKRGAGADATRKEGDGELEARVTRLQARVEAQISRLQAVRTLRFRSARWSRLQQNAAAILERLPDLPFDVPGLSSAIGSISAATGVTMYGGFAIVSAAPLIALFELVIALLEAAAAVLALALVGWALYELIELIIERIEAIVELIEAIIEIMRHRPPIFWPMLLPVPGPIGMPMVRTKPPNPRIPGGGQDQLRPLLPADQVVHHTLPLFLGGLDLRSNVEGLPQWQHQVGHGSLLSQAQMHVWGYSANLYDHPPPDRYFLGGRKLP